MKRALQTLAVLLLSGCAPGHFKAKYVRDPAHHCKHEPSALFEANTTMVDQFGRTRIAYGWKYYSCADKVVVIIDNDEEQP